MGGTCGVTREREGPQGVSFCFVSSLGSLHLVGSVFICNILSMGCIFSVLISRKIDPCFPGGRHSLCVVLLLRSIKRMQVRPLFSPHLLE